MKKFLAALLLLVSPAFAQSVQQSGNVTPGHVPYWVTSGVIADGGSSASSPITSLGITNNGGAGFCVNSDLPTSIGFNSLCFGASTSAAATISLQNYGSANPEGLNFVVNGTVVSLPTGGSSLISGNGPFTANHVPCFVNSLGVVQDCGLALSSGTVTSGVWQGTAVAIGFGGTGATSASGARTNLGLGTMATQNASAVAITGGAITGMPTPVNTTDVAIKSYVDATAMGLIIQPPSTLATAAVLPNTPTYNNGASGVGATLTAGSHTTLTVDSTAAPINTVVLVKNQAAPGQNGIYTVTTAGDGSTAWVLTRATYFDQAAEMKAGSYTFITSGSVNANSSYVLATTIATVGTDAVTFNQFSQSSGGVTNINGVTGAVALGTGLGTTGSTLSNTGVTSLGSMTGAITCGVGSTCGSSTITPNGTGGIYDAVVAYGADPTGVSSSTTAIRNAVVAACITGSKGRVYLRAGLYKIDGGLNLTGITQECIIYGDGALTTVLETTSGATNAMIDLVGSAGVSIRDLQINSNANTSGNVSYGILLAPTVAQGCDVMSFYNVSVTGYFGQAAVYNYGCSDSLFELMQVSNFYTGAIYVTFISTTNVLNATSNFTTIATGAQQAGDLNFISYEIHDLSTFAGNTHSTVTPLYISGSSSPIKFYGGVIAGAPTGNNGYVQFAGTVTNVSFIGEQLYADNGQSSPYGFYNAGSTVSGLVVQSTNAIVTTALFDVATGTTWAHMNVTGNASFGAVPMFSPLSSNSGTLVSSIVDAQGQAINLGGGGSLTHTIMLQPGAITAGTQSNNGSF